MYQEVFPQGEVSFQLQDLLLYTNDLGGTIPTELGSLSHLWRINLGANNLQGTIPPQLGFLPNLEHLLLGGNSLSGTIPPQLAESLLSEPLADFDAPDPPDRATARRWLGDMTDMALVDGEISSQEKRLLVEVGRSSGLVAADINLVIAKRRAQARKRLRQQASTYA